MSRMNKLLRFLCMVAGVALIINAVTLAPVSNFNAGIILTFVAGLVLFLYGFLLQKISIITKSGPLKWLKYFIFTGCILVAGFLVFLFIYGHTDTATYEEDALIVLGAALRGDQPTRPLVRRLNKAIDYAEQNPKAVIVVTGGQGPQETMPEGEAMAAYLVSHGVAPERILVEDKSTSTYENFVFTKVILDDYFHEPYTTTVITNDFHIFRAVDVARATGFQATRLHSTTDWYIAPNHYFRECLALLKWWILAY